MKLYFPFTSQFKTYVVLFISSLFLILLFTKCALLGFNIKTEIPDNIIPPDKIELRRGVELSGLRVDLYRNTYTETTTDSNGNEEKKTVDMSYRPIGFYISKGVFYDSHKNLSLIIPDLFGLTDSQDYEITEIEHGFFSDSKRIISKKGDTITRMEKGLLSNYKEVILISENSITSSDNSLFLGKEEIKIMPDQLIYDPKSLFKNFAVEKIVTFSGGYKIPHFIADEIYTQPEPDRIILDNYFKVNRFDMAIEFSMSKFSNYQLYKLRDGYFYDSGYGSGERVVVKDSIIELIENRKTIKTFLLK